MSGSGEGQVAMAAPRESAIHCSISPGVSGKGTPVRCNFLHAFIAVIAGLPAVGGSVIAADPPGPPDGLNLPALYRQLIADRAVIDRYQLRYHQVAPGAPEPAPVRPVPPPDAAGPVVRVVTPRHDPRTVAYRAQFPERFMPLRGFRAPILAEATNQPPPVLWEERRAAGDRQAAELVNRRLAFDGLLPTLVQVVHALGPDSLRTNQVAANERLRAVGFPVDLLACFAPTNKAAVGASDADPVQRVARQLIAGNAVERVQAEMRAVPFHVPDGWTGFQIASEAGDAALEMVRMQFGGGFREGIVPGDSLDVIGQMLRALPEVEFVVTVPREFSRPFQTLALRSWGLTERTRVTVIEEAFRMNAWAQDNGKAGTLTDPRTGRNVRATLVPRYASRDEGISSMLASESFLMDGLAAAGEAVRHFPLLFQGGNLIAVTAPEPGARVLLVSESDVLRNLMLGLARDQVVELFRRGFGVDRCVVLPAVSYHLDFDVSVRLVAGRPVVLVNDPLGAARIILRLGVEAMRGRGHFAPELADQVIADLRGGPGDFAHDNIVRVLDEVRPAADDRYPVEFARLFEASAVDSAAGNLQCFLQALDLLAISFTEAGDRKNPERDRFLAALRRSEDARQAQLAALAETGWRVVAIPSMPNLFRSINYLNGIHHPGGFLMPAFGGFYAPLDRAAESAFREMAPGVTVRTIQCAELQRYFGGVHCAAAAYSVPPGRPVER